MKKIVLKSIIVLILSLFLYKCIFLVDGKDYEYLLGDLNQDELIDTNDVIYLLMYTYFSDSYPVEQDCDYDNDGLVNTNDVIYLLMHTYFPDDYPLFSENDNLKETKLIVYSEPNKVTYNEGEGIDLKGLVVKVVYSNNESKVIYDYDIYYDELVLGENKITIKYNDLETFFKINIVQKAKMSLVEHIDYSPQTTKGIQFDDYTSIFEEVKFGANRLKDMMIAYDKNHYVKTNIYGYEVAIDKYGQVVEMNQNVSLLDEGIVISAHGQRVSELKSLEIGDFVLFYNNRVYVYKNKDIIKKNFIFSKFYELVDYLETIDDIDIYNDGISQLNELIPHLDYYYNQYDLELEKYLIDNLGKIQKIDIKEHEHEYTYSQETYDEYEIVEEEKHYDLFTTYNDKLYIGGFRNSDTLVYYDSKHYRERNPYGYEVSVDKNGYVVNKDTLVDLEEGGFILSGHTSTAEFLYLNVEISDRIEIIDGKVYIYRDNIDAYSKKYVKLRNDLVTQINAEKEREIPHDYQYIDEIISIIDEELSKINKADLSVYKYIKISQAVNKVSELIALAYGQLIEYEADQTRGIWYYPFGKLDIYDDTTLEGVKTTLLTFKKMGINEVIIHTFYKDYSLFDNSIFQKSNILDDLDYGEYGKDYLKCFIEEAHKLNISVSAFTQTFLENIDSMKNPNDDYYQINYQGEKSFGQVHYYDICNDNIQDILLIWYKELLTKYNFDKVEYDIIRYPESNLYKYLEVEEIPEEVVIRDHGYTEYSMEKFMTLYGLNGDLRELIRKSKDVRIKWLMFKEQELVNFITNCTNELRNIKPNIKMTAAVFNMYESAKNGYLQDYKKWLELGIVDEIEIMMYTVSNYSINEMIDDATYLIENYETKLGLSPRLDGGDIITDIQQIRMGTTRDGFILFSSNLYYGDMLESILSNSFHSAFVSSFVSEEEIKNAKINDCIDMIEGYYQIKNQCSYDELIESLRQDNFTDHLEQLADQKMKEYLIKKLA